MSELMAEFLGTMILVLLGDGVVANVVLKRTKGHASGWLVITTGWALAVTIAVYLTRPWSGAHLNPAVTVGLWCIQKISAADAAGYVLAQMAGAIVGAALVWLAYLPHWKETPSEADKLGVFCNSPAIPNIPANLVTEIIGTFVLVLGVLGILRPDNFVKGTGLDEAMGPLMVGLMVWSVGISLGGPTGYAINPARDLGPRIAHFLLPIPGKGSSDWGYAWIPVVGPIIGGVMAAFFYQAIWTPA